MAPDYLIGVDLGTSVVKTTLFDTAGRSLADATRTAALSQPAPGFAEQRGEDFYAATLATIREVVDKTGTPPAAVAAIAFDGQMAGAIGIDREWNALTPWYPSALDNRYQPYIGSMQERVGDQLVALNGSLPFMAPRMLWWQDQHPDLYRRIHKVLMLANYVAGRMANLAAGDAFIDPSYLTWIGVSDTARRAWSEELAAACGIPLEKLPRIVPSTAVVGRLSAAAATACGLAAGVPLVAGAGDQVAGFIGAGLVEPGQLVDVAGTFPVLATSLNKYFADTQYGMLQPLAGPLGPDHWYPMMYISGGGLTHRWYRDQFAAEEMHQAAVAGTSAYYLLDAQAALVPPGSEGLMFIPHLVGRACPTDPAGTRRLAGFHLDAQESAFLPRAAGINCLRLCGRIGSGAGIHPHRPLQGSAGDRRRRPKRPVEPDQGRRVGGALRPAGASRRGGPGLRHHSGRGRGDLSRSGCDGGAIRAHGQPRRTAACPA